MIENIEDLESSLNLEKGSLSKAIESEDKVSIDISGLKINTLDDHNTLLENTKSNASKIAQELQLKEMKETLNLDYEGRKDPANFITAFTEKITKEAGKEPEQKFTELKDSFDKLQDNFKVEQSRYNDLIETTKAEKVVGEIDSKIKDSIPKNLNISNDDAVLLFKSKYKAELGENKSLVISKDGNIIKDDIENPKSISDIMSDFVTPYLKKVDGGKGGEDFKSKGKPNSMESFIKRMNDEGVSQGSADFSKRMNSAIADKTLSI